jgi:hypothetical protein
MILAATPDAVYRTPQNSFDDVERVLDAGAVRQLAVADRSSVVFAATGTGLYRTIDGGDSWVDLDVSVGVHEPWHHDFPVAVDDAISITMARSTRDHDPVRDNPANDDHCSVLRMVLSSSTVTTTAS